MRLTGPRAGPGLLLGAALYAGSAFLTPGRGQDGTDTAPPGVPAPQSLEGVLPPSGPPPGLPTTLPSLPPGLLTPIPVPSGATGVPGGVSPPVTSGSPAPPAPGAGATGTTAPVRSIQRVLSLGATPREAAFLLGQEQFTTRRASLDAQSCSSCHQVRALRQAAREYPRYNPLLDDVCTLEEAVKNCSVRWFRGRSIAPGSRHGLALSVFLLGQGPGQ